MKVHLELGSCVITPGAREALSDREIITALERHQSGDWGEVCKDDWVTNNLAIKRGERVLSAYIGADGNTFWIITEADRSHTTILLPEDY
jgi:hypothetical protein